jgi:hypothetical protein
MSSLTHSRLISLAPAPARAASLKQVLRHQLAVAWDRAWVAMETTARLRAAPMLLQQAERVQPSNPELADALRRVARGEAPQPFITAADTPAAVR